MRIHFSPQRSTQSLTLERQGETLIVNGDPLDFSELPDGGSYPPASIDNPMMVGGVERIAGIVHVTVRLPYSNPTPPSGVAFAEPIEVTADGPVALPPGLEAPDAAE